MNNIHLFTEPDTELITNIIDDVNLTPTARYILINMITDKPYTEDTILEELIALTKSDVNKAFELLVTNGYLKRIVSPFDETQFYVAINKEFDEYVSYFN